MWDLRFCCVLLIYAISLTISKTQAYDDPSGPQYHIQTDEGPERYFRYQTLSGQYRKEKRLEDGTVIGTYAWIDDDGILRQRDYIADTAGYRITKSKNLFVGKAMPVGEAVKAAKKYPASAGTLVSAKTRPVPPLVTTTPSPPPLPSSTAQPCASCLLTPTTYKPDVSYFVSSTLSPHVEISNNALASSTSFPVESSTVKPYVEINHHGISSTTGLPLEYLKGLPNYQEQDQNSLDYNPYVNQGLFFQNGPTYPIDRNGHTYRGNKRYSNPNYNNKQYDGVSVTNDGFRYYIPRAYHEEQIGTNNEKEGSFGYIDPFGIRRVVYYNAKPGEGFQHRKNNRYVGFDATPYDPRPY
ncbi:unnamed protein product [Ceutorhynchus assimilis]|uniref:Cuticle protein 6 n=1 Tax=Ceutorhynchus assimilis TaxID=467358 RepID=A0A9N9MUQ0_9CUCU|nr:unnamed protein product [Ceutorhynchus assimilis]